MHLQWATTVNPRKAGCLWVHVAALRRQVAVRLVAGRCLDEVCGPRAVRPRAVSRKNHRGERAERRLILMGAPASGAGRLRLAGPPPCRPTKAVSRMPRATSRGSIVVEAPWPAQVKPPGQAPPTLPARAWPNPPQPAPAQPAWSRMLAVPRQRSREAQPWAMRKAPPQVGRMEWRQPAPSQRPADPSTPESDPPCQGQDSPGRLP